VSSIAGSASAEQRHAGKGQRPRSSGVDPRCEPLRVNVESADVVDEVGRLRDNRWKSCSSRRRRVMTFSSAISVAKSIDKEQNMNMDIIVFNRGCCTP
jgi:hypothetical protein